MSRKNQCCKLTTIIGEISKIECAKSWTDVMRSLKTCFSLYNSQHYIITGLPMPGKRLNDLILEIDWKDFETGRNYTPDSNEIIINKCVDWKNFLILKEHLHSKSGLAQAAGLPRDNLDILMIPIDPIYQFQGACILTIEKIPDLHEEIAMNNISFADRTALKCAISASFIRAREFNMLKMREGELTSRERQVVSLCALGYTSGQISQAINISKRTVVAHVQNASMKLDARNKTECVIQAIRYNQIGVGTKTHRGFFEIENEILAQQSYDAKMYF
ncbi:MAG: LuxR C-terminal-related transcriptional regulator [Lentilitoribacter sp.]